MTIKRIGHRYIDAATGATIDTWFPRNNEKISRSCPAEKLGLLNSDFVDIEITDFAAPPTSTEEAYLRLHLLSECAVKPHEINLDGVFGLLNNVAWTTAGPILATQVLALRNKLAESGDPHHLGVASIDKFPRMTDYVIPEGVRIGNANRVRLGAHLAPGTTIMHEGFVNFNAGTLGESMVEGRISAGVVVGKHSDIGGGASIMGTLSGGGKAVISIGEHSLLGANSGLGISLGDHCTVEAGLYLTTGTKVTLPDETTVAARELSGQDNWLFRRNSLSGAVEAIPTEGNNWGGLNSMLHQND